MRFAGRTISFQGALFALICFFLPWVTVSCGERTTTVTGMQTALGGTIQTNQGPEQRNPDVFIIMVLLAAIGIAAIWLVAWVRKVANRKQSIGVIVLGALAVLILGARYATQQTDLSGDVPIYVTYHAGFYGAWLGYAAALIGGIVDLIGPGRGVDTSPP